MRIASETPAIYRTIGQWVRRERLARGIKQEELAALVGLSRPTMSMIERGRQTIAVHQLLAIEAGLRGVPAAGRRRPA